MVEGFASQLKDPGSPVLGVEGPHPLGNVRV